MAANKPAPRPGRDKREAPLPLVAAPRLVPAAGYRATLRSILVGPSVTRRIMRSPGILVFDSGVGGLTVFREILRARPDARLIYAADDALFSIREIDMGMAADVGTLQRLPRLIGDGMMREMAYTGRNVKADEALRIGLVNRTFAGLPQLLDGVFEIAREIAAKSPIAISGSKRMIGYMRDHSVDDGLEYVATWNAAMLQSADLKLAMVAHMGKQKPVFDN